MQKKSKGARQGKTAVAGQAEQVEGNLAAIRRMMRQPLEAEIRKGNLTAPQKSVMQAVVHKPGISLKDLSRAVSLAHSTTSGIVDRLEKRGMIERKADEADGRVSRIYPTAVVTRFVHESIPALRSGPLLRALERASATERAKIAWSLQRLRELMES